MTEKLRTKQRQADKTDAQWIDTLVQRYTCGMSTCPNEKSYCLLVDDVHLRLMPQQLKTWSMAINVDEATLEDCPTDVIKTLMPAVRTQKNPLRAEHAKLVKKALEPAPATIATPQHVYQYPPLSTYSYPPYMPSYPQAMYPHCPERSQSPIRAAIPPLLASSPIHLESDHSVDKLRDYFDWLIRGFPGKSEQLKLCLETLRSEEIVFTTLHEVPTELWREWKISHGLILLVKGHIKKWERELVRKRS